MKKIILEREQFYLDLLLPSLNVNKIAGSMLGFKHSEENLLKISQIQRGKNKSSPREKRKDSPVISPETINKLKQRANGVIIKVFDQDGVLAKEFSTIVEAANFYGVKYTTISKYAETGKLWDNELLFKKEFKPKAETQVFQLKVSEPLPLDELQFNSKGNLVKVIDKDNIVAYQFLSVRDTASYLGISHPTVLRYIKNGRLWNNLYTFKVHTSTPSNSSTIPPFLLSTKSSNELQISSFPCTVEVYDPSGNRVEKFDSISKAAEFLGINRSTIHYNANKGKLWKGKYFFKLVPMNSP